MLEYIPKDIVMPPVADVVSLWGNMPTLLSDIIKQFNIPTDLALEFGVFKGYSTSALAHYFKKVIGVDPFDWDCYESVPSEKDLYLQVIKSLRDYSNIQLIRGFFEDYIITPTFDRFDLIHIDIGYQDHNYKTTYPCGEWSVQHSDCVIFHDTESFTEVKQACQDLADKYKFEFYNYPHDSGLGILKK